MLGLVQSECSGFILASFLASSEILRSQPKASSEDKAAGEHVAEDRLPDALADKREIPKANRPGLLVHKRGNLGFPNIPTIVVGYPFSHYSASTTTKVKVQKT